jgi:hypothetical protein
MQHKARAFLVAFAALAASAALGQKQTEPAPSSVSPMIAETLAPVLASWIVSAQAAAKAEGVEPMPASIRAALTGYVPDAVLDRVRWRVGGSEMSLPQNVIRFGDVPAMTLVDVVVFQERRPALEDPKLWAHELYHVMQYEEWGVDEFALRYLSDYEAVEEPAWEFRWEFMKKAGLLPEVPPPAQ